MRIGNEIVTASALGKRRRMFRIFGDKGKCISFPVPNPDFVLYEWLRDLEECKGWKSKRIEAEQVYQKKSSLHIYLERAFRILGIEY